MQLVYWQNYIFFMKICFVDIGGIVDHHCLNFLLITEGEGR